MTTKEVTKSPIPRKLNQGMIEALSEYIRKGNYACVACALCDIQESTYYNWLEQAGKDSQKGLESIYTTLMESIKRAEADAEALMVKTARDAAVEKKDGYLAITVNERRHPERWGRKDRTRVDFSGKVAHLITHVEVVLNQGEGQKVIEGEYREVPNAIEQGKKQGKNEEN